MKKLMVAVVALGVTLGARAEEYTLGPGETATMPVGNFTWEKMTIAGDLTVPGFSTNTTATVSVPGGSVTAQTKGVIGKMGAAADFTLSQGADGVYGRLATAGGVLGARDTLTIAKPTVTPISGLSDDGYLDFLTLNGGGIYLHAIKNNSTVTGRVTVAGSGGSFYSQSWAADGRFNTGAFVLRLVDGAPFNFSMSNAHGSWNANNVSIRTEGTGDIRLLGNGMKSDTDDYPLYIRTGAYFNHTGKLCIGRTSSGSNWNHVRIQGDDVVGPNVTGIYAYKNGSINANTVNFTLDADKTLTVRNFDLSGTSATAILDGGGLLRVGSSAEETSVFAVNSFKAETTLAVEKIGANVLTFSVTKKDVPSLTLSGGTVRFAADTTVASLVPNGGALAVTAGKVLCVDAGLADGTLRIEPPSGGDWPRGEHLICYYKGEDPTGLSAEVRFGDKATFAAEEVTEGEYAGYKALMLTVEYTGKTIHLTENDAEIDLCELMGGSLSVPCDVIIDAGVTNYNTTALTGIYPLTVTGGGVLVLNASSPDYTGEVYIGNASVRVTADQPFGTGKVTIAGYVGAGNKTSRIQFANTEEITIPNELEIVDSGENAVFSSLKGAKKVTFTGAVVARTGLRISDGHSTSTSTAIYWSFQDTVDVDAGLLYLEGYGSMELCAKSTAPTLYAQGGGSPAGKPQIHLYSSDNVIGCIQSRWEGAIFAEAENAWGGGRISDNTGYEMTFSLKTYDQVMKYINAGIYTGTSMSTEAQIVADAAGATLTLTGTTSSQTTHRMRLNGGVSLVLDSANANFVQTFKGGTSTTKGSITAKSGTLAFTDDIDKTGKQKLLSTNYVSLVNVPQLNVTGGAIRISPIRDGIFAGVTNLTVSAGSFAVEGPGQEPFGPLASTKAIVSLSGSGTMAIADGLTVSVKCLLVDGQFVEEGRYTGEGGPSDATVLPQLTGTGVLAVRRSGLGLYIILR